MTKYVAGNFIIVLRAIIVRSLYHTFNKQPSRGQKKKGLISIDHLKYKAQQLKIKKKNRIFQFQIIHDHVLNYYIL